MPFAGVHDGFACNVLDNFEPESVDAVHAQGMAELRIGGALNTARAALVRLPSGDYPAAGLTDISLAGFDMDDAIDVAPPARLRRSHLREEFVVLREVSHGGTPSLSCH